MTSTDNPLARAQAAVSGLAREVRALTCVGYKGAAISHLWFSPYFLKHGRIEAPACIWEVQGNKVSRTYKDDYVRPSGLPNPPPAIWVLTDVYDPEGFRLGVWPD